MGLNKASIVIRQRVPWEGVDLGFAMARRWFLPLWGLWWLTALPVALPVYLLLGPENAWAGLLVWWCKPLYEWGLLYWLSRRVFGESLYLKEIPAAWGRSHWGDLLPYLSWRRFTPYRSFTTPVGMLEQLRSEQRGQRVEILARGQTAAVWMMLVCVNVEILLVLSLILFMGFFAVNEYGSDHVFDFVWLLVNDYPWLSAFLSLLSLSFIAPFYVAAGFGLYLTRRTKLEAWDLDLAFRGIRSRMDARRKSSILVFCLGIFLLPGMELGHAQEGYAEQQVHGDAVEGINESSPDKSHQSSVVTPEYAAEVIAQVMADESFGRTTTVQSWQFMFDEEEEEEALSNTGLAGFISVLGVLVEGLLWLLIAGAIAFGLYHVADWLGWLAPPALDQSTAPSAQVINEAATQKKTRALPQDVNVAVQAHIKNGRYREALSLLYRASLHELVEQGLVEIPESATEGECRELVRRHCQPEQVGYFDGLTRAWVHAAYGPGLPSPSIIRHLHEAWPKVFAAPA